ncbi:MAG: sigma-70 family RNA polymerase sigma factor, partial [Clostridia bacterium]|nr:sigma-70 family RNA polymerase sigma factor [Clostridia bacterium]
MRKTENEFIDGELLESTFLFCCKKLGNSHDAEDLTQEIMLEAVKALRSGREIENFYAWFWAMAKNRVNMAYRMKKFHAVQLDLMESVLESGERVEDGLIRQEEISELNYAVSRLSRLHREVIILFYLREMKISGIAETLGVPEGTVKGRLRDAKNEIRKGISEMNENTGRS